MAEVPLRRIRGRFPALDGEVVQLDNAAGSQVPDVVPEPIRGG